MLLAPSAECAARVEEALAECYQSTYRGVAVDIVGDDAQLAVERSRSRYGGAALGCVCVDEVQALAALGAGADEILVWPPLEDTAIRGFFDRTRLRAGARRGQEQLTAAVAHAEKLTALGTLVGGVAHEINNPLMALQLSVEAFSSLMTPVANVTKQVRLWASRGWGATPAQVQNLREMLRTGASEREAKELLDEMLIASTAISSVIRDLRVFARPDSDKEEPQLIDTHDLIEQAVRLVGREVEATGHIERDFAADIPPIIGPRGRLSQVLVNILVNAAHAIREVERSVHRVRISTRADDDLIAIAISDTGPGIAPEDVEHIFDPFFTTKRAGMGTGLGLSISRSIMQDLGGDLIVESVHGTGATFIVLVPVPEQAAVRDAYLNSRQDSTQSDHFLRKNILVVDEDERIVKAYARVLGRHSNVIVASDGQEAMDLLTSGSTVDMMITELNLPEVDGQSLFEWLQETHPKLARHTVFVTAETTQERRRDFLSHIPNPVLTKPVTASALLETLESEVSNPTVTSEGNLGLFGRS